MLTREDYETAKHGVEAYSFILPIGKQLTGNQFAGLMTNHYESIKVNTIASSIGKMVKSICKNHQEVKVVYHGR